ncbi:MAG: penicillin acylase family protein [Bacteroidia bacterium]|nr:penicillin acylase family protein [Bacteroidia bacterium]
MKHSFAALSLFLLWGNLLLAQIDPTTITIIRDTFGVAHIHAPTDAGAAYGFAWAQAEDDFMTVQLTLLPVRGRMAEYNGKQGAILDVAAAMIGIDTLVDQRYEQDLSPAFRQVVEAFAAGLNAYAANYPEELLLDGLLPFTGQDVIKGYVLETAFLTGLQGPLEDLFANRLPTLDLPMPAGSNAFAFSPKKTADGHTYFCSNSHQPLQGMFSWYEAHVTSDEGWNFLGATFPGGVTPFVGTNENLGWSHTVNHPDFVDTYQLQMNPEEKLSYYVDGEWLKLQEHTVKLKVKLFAGVKIPVKQTFYRSIYGLTIENKQGFFALRFPANHDIRAAEQWYKMNKASDFEEFREALTMTAIPGTNIVYADREGNIFYVGNAKFPRRNPAYDYSGLVPGNTKATLWEEFVPFDSLAMALNPDCGYVFNSNHSPFFSTAAADAPDVNALPYGHGYLTLHNNRSLRFYEQLEPLDKVTWEDMLRIKYDLRYSDSLYDPIVTNWSDLLKLSPVRYPALANGLALLNAWDKQTTPESVGASLFLMCWHFMYEDYHERGLWKYGQVASEAELATALSKAMAQLEKYFGSIEVPLGEMQRHRRGEVDLPVGGGPEILAAMYSAESKKGRFESMVGDGFIQFVSYDQSGPVLIETMMPYGASSKAESPHFTNQMQMYVGQQRKVMSLDWEEVVKSQEQSYHPK